jgi:hypothetical protein
MIICSKCENEFCGDCDCIQNIYCCIDCNLILCNECLGNEDCLIQKNCHYEMDGNFTKFYCKNCYYFKKIKFIDEFTVYCEIINNNLNYLFRIDKSYYKKIVNYDQYKIAFKNTIKYLLQYKLNINMINIINVYGS